MPIVRCKICKKSFYAKPSHLKLGYGQYCSRVCQAQGQRKGKNVICFSCGKRVWRMPKELRSSKSGKFFCNKSCQTLWRNNYYSGERHPNWKGGEHQEYKIFLLRSGKEKICQVCGTTDERILVVHHKDKIRSHNNICNLIWLCLNCHYLVHKHNVSINHGGRSLAV